MGFISNFIMGLDTANDVAQAMQGISDSLSRLGDAADTFGDAVIYAPDRHEWPQNGKSAQLVALIDQARDDIEAARLKFHYAETMLR